MNTDKPLTASDVIRSQKETFDRIGAAMEKYVNAVIEDARNKNPEMEEWQLAMIGINAQVQIVHQFYEGVFCAPRLHAQLKAPPTPQKPATKAPTE